VTPTSASGLTPSPSGRIIAPVRYSALCSPLRFSALFPRVSRPRFDFAPRRLLATSTCHGGSHETRSHSLLQTIAGREIELFLERKVSVKSRKRIVIVFTSVLLAATCSSPLWAAEARVQVPYKFKGGKDGLGPQAGLVVDSFGNLYGTTQLGGGNYRCQHGCGTVFELSPPGNGSNSWTETVLYRFTGKSDGAEPLGKVIFDAQGNLYGTTYAGGDFNSQACMNSLGMVTACGVVFELSAPAVPGGAWTETVLHSFVGSDGARPNAGLTFDDSGNLYGTTTAGGTPCGGPGCGVVFELSPPLQPGGEWTYAAIHEFTGGSDGNLSFADLTLDAAQNLYGTTCGGGDNGGGGVVFELSPPLQQGGDWTETTLHSFPIPSCPHAGVVFDSASNLFGTTSGGNNLGTVFELSPSSNGMWTETTIYSFQSLSADSPEGAPVFDRLGNIYGTLHGGTCGAIYRLVNHEGVWKESQYIFPNQQSSQPCGPIGALVFGKGNALYGTSVEGGGCSGFCGTVFGVLP